VIEGRSLEHYVESLKGRIQALSFAHDQVVRGEGGGALSVLINAELSPYRSADSAISVDADHVWVDSRAYSVMALVLHELATNAAKYGALSVSGANLDVRARIVANGDAVVEWVERGGPAVSPPSREGFGTALLDRSVPFDLGGESDVKYLPSGLVASFRLPARHVRRATERDIEAAPGKLGRPAPARLADVSREIKILLLEDQMLIAMDVESMLGELGFMQVTTTSSAAEALKHIARAPVGVAILDVNLGDGTSVPVAEALREKGVPFIFATGYGEGEMIPDELRDAPLIRKPYNAEALRRAIACVLTGR
jgi:two-component sensor histidine kinase/CheY-like chemotaxis protein